MPTRKAVLLICSAVLLNTYEVFSAEAAPKMALLWPEGAPGAAGKEDRDQPSLYIYLPEKQTTKAGVIVCPGGGYNVLAIDHEGQQVARWLNSIDVAAFVLKYRLKPRYQPSDALLDGQRAIRHVRQHAREYGVSPQRVGMLGFSAGAHLAACSGIAFDGGNPAAADSVEKLSSRPDFMILCYGGATTLSAEKEPPPDAKAFTKEAPPAFVFTTSEDGKTDRYIECFQALRKVGVPAELHVFGGFGPHGTGMAPGDSGISQWPALAATWMRKSGLLNDAAREAVAGRVVIDGKPLNRGWVTFIPIDDSSKPIAAAHITQNSGGKFTLAAKDGPCAGPHRIEIRRQAMEFLATPSMNDGELFRTPAPGNASPIVFEIKSGENSAVFEIQTK